MTVKKSLTEVVKELGNVLSHLIRTQPLYSVLALLIVAITIYFLFGTDSTIVVFLSILITFTSFILYMSKDNYTEAFLTFFLGILTVFTINWDHEKAVTFIISYSMLNIIIFLGSGMKLNAKVENILKRSASYHQNTQINATYKLLRLVVERRTNFGQIGIVEKCEIVDFMCFLKVPLSKLAQAVNAIERFKIISRASLTLSLNLYKLIFTTAKQLHSNHDEIEHYVQSHFRHLTELPLTAEQMLTLFQESRILLLLRKIEVQDFYKFIWLSLDRGVSEQEVVSQLKKIYKIEPS